MGTLILLRHGQSQWNLENRFTGWTDVDLSEQGRREARQAGRLIKRYRIDRAFCSVLIRAKHTLDLALEEAGQAGIPVEYDQALNERHYGDLQGLNKKETAERVGAEQVQRWRRSYDTAPPNGESLKDTIERVLPYFNDEILPCVKQGETVLVSAHGNSLRGLVMQLDQLSEDEVVGLEIPTGQPLVYHIDENGAIEKEGYIE
ncbi:MAG: 2,3-bisphosphoglycerate-dependent phosphoglycerate mutase [Planctomycetota bacterium]